MRDENAGKVVDAPGGFRERLRPRERRRKDEPRRYKKRRPSAHQASGEDGVTVPLSYRYPLQCDGPGMRRSSESPVHTQESALMQRSTKSTVIVAAVRWPRS